MKSEEEKQSSETGWMREQDNDAMPWNVTAPSQKGRRNTRRGVRAATVRKEKQRLKRSTGMECNVYWRGGGDVLDGMRQGRRLAGTRNTGALEHWNWNWNWNK